VSGSMTNLLGTRRLTRLGLLTAMALVLFLVEAALPRPLPWMKLGLGNAAVLAALLLFGAGPALARRHTARPRSG